MNCFILVELEAERKKVGDITAELEERKQREEEERKDLEDRFSQIYENNIGKKVYYYFIMKQDKSYLKIWYLLCLFWSSCILKISIAGILILFYFLNTLLTYKLKVDLIYNKLLII